MAGTVQLGPFMLQWALAAWIAGAVAGYAVMRVRLRKTAAGGRICGIALNAVLLMLIGWKFAGALFDPSVIWQDPRKFLLSNGTHSGLWVGIALALIYAAVSLRGLGLSARVFLDALPYGILSALSIKSLFYWQYGKITTLPWGVHVQDPRYRYHPLNAYLLIVCALLLGLIWMKRRTPGDGADFREFLIYGGAGFLLVSLFAQPGPGLFYLSWAQWANVLMIAAGFMFEKKLRNAY